MKRITVKHYTAECWLKARLGKKAYERALDLNYDCVQEWRHRWLDALILEFSK